MTFPIEKRWRQTKNTEREKTAQTKLRRTPSILWSGGLKETEKRQRKRGTNRKGSART